ncbi:MAG: NADH-quinone oxidoreductase subunit C [Verrucomicrobiales bacterium]|jgi:NADH-quinone oxidoreductase subunit C|nr:NADH-quinone oxidoreductase subunit C [Verrucomicrobiales bacterium]
MTSTSSSDLNEKFSARFPGKIEFPEDFRGETTWLVAKDSLLDIMRALKAEGFNYLADICSVDNSGQEPRFEMIYELLDLNKVKYLRIKTKVGEEESVPSVVSVWRTANWHEREVYDMMGVNISGHPDLRRILMWEGYPYYPLRKEFPLEGKKTELPDIAFTRPAPLEGGPFVTSPTGEVRSREPRSRAPEL